MACERSVLLCQQEDAFLRVWLSSIYDFCVHKLCLYPECILIQEGDVKFERCRM